MHWISRPTKACSSRQNLMSAFTFARSKSSLSRAVPSLPRLSRSSRRITVPAPSCSISAVASRKDLPPVFTVTNVPLTPNSSRAHSVFFAFDNYGFAPRRFLCQSGYELLKLLQFVFETGRQRGYLVILACRTVSKQSMASLLFAK